MHSDMILRESIIRSTKVLAGKNIRVVMEGFAPHVKFDTKTKKPFEIVLPMIPDSCPLPLVNAIKGYQDHEVYHILYSSADDICDSSKGQVWHYLHNVVDDNFINAKGAKAFPGTHIEIFNGYRYIQDNMPAYEHGHITRVFGVNEKQAQAGYLVSWVARKMESEFQSDWYDASPLVALMKPLDDALHPALLEKMQKCQDPDDVRAITDGLYDFCIDMDLMEHLKKIAENDGKSGGHKPEKGEKGEEEGKKSEAEGEGEEDEIDAEDLPGSFEDALGDLIGKKIAIEFKNKKGTFFWSDRMNEVLTLEDYASSSRGRGYDVASTVGLSEFERSCKEQSNFLRKRLERLLESRNRVYYTGGYKSGKLNGKQLATIPCGNTYVFSRKNDVRSLNAAVGLLCDLSGSMSGEKVKLAAQSTFTMADCLEKLNIPFEALGFWTDQPMNLKQREIDAAWEKFNKDNDSSITSRVVSRRAPESTIIFKGFNEVFGLKHKAGLMSASKSHIGMANNNDATHLRIALERLSKQPQEKKVLFVFSDGQPAFSGTDTYDNARSKLKELAQNAKKEYGVTVVGVGIKTDSVSKFYDNAKVINKLEELPNTVFEILTKQLLSGK